MTEEQQEYLEFKVQAQLDLLVRVLHEQHQNQWSETFNANVEETRDKIIYDLENYFLEPTMTLNPLRRVFRGEDEDMRLEIATEVGRLFRIFRRRQNDQ